MKAYLAILYARMATLLQYRGAAFAGVATQIFWAIIKIMIFTAFYAQTSTSQPISLGPGHHIHLARAGFAGIVAMEY